MQKDTFHDHLLKATGHSVKCAREFVRNQLPESFRYVVHLNQSYDGNTLESGEYVYPDDVARHGSAVGPLLAEQVADLLWRNGLVPEWIDISVSDADGTHTFMELLCCGRFTDREEHLYYAKTDVCPFGCKSPTMPPGWEVGDEPFDLHWNAGKKPA